MDINDFCSILTEKPLYIDLNKDDPNYPRYYPQNYLSSGNNVILNNTGDKLFVQVKLSEVNNTGVFLQRIMEKMVVMIGS